MPSSDFHRVTCYYASFDNIVFLLLSVNNIYLYVVVFLLCFAGIARTGAKRQIPYTILYVYRLWKSTQEVSNAQSCQTSKFRGETGKIWIVYHWHWDEYFICDSIYQKVPVVVRLNLELRGCKVKNIVKYGPKVDFEISHINTVLILYVTSKVWPKKQYFHVKMTFDLLLYKNTLPRFQNF